MRHNRAEVIRKKAANNSKTINDLIEDLNVGSVYLIQRYNVIIIVLVSRMN